MGSQSPSTRAYRASSRMERGAVRSPKRTSWFTRSISTSSSGFSSTLRKRTPRSSGERLTQGRPMAVAFPKKISEMFLILILKWRHVNRL